MASLNVTDIGAEYQNKMSSVGVKAVASQAVLMTVFSLLVVVAFNVLRPRNKIVYSPRQYVDENRQIAPPSAGFLSWVPVLLRTKEDEIVEKLGVDVAVYLRFHRLLRTLLILVSLTSLSGLLPINIIYNLRFVPSTSRNSLSTCTIQELRGAWLWGPVASSYVFTAYALLLIWYHYREVLGRRIEYFVSPAFVNRLSHRSLMVVHVPEEMQSDEALGDTIRCLPFPFPPRVVTIGHEIGELPDMIEEKQDAVRSLEKSLLKFLKGGKLAAKRPTTARWWKPCGVSEDAIDSQTSAVRRLESEIYEQRKKFRDTRPESYGFVQFESAAQAQAALKKCHGVQKRHQGIKIISAPQPEDVIWRNIAFSRKELLAMRIVFAILVGGVVFFYTIPLALISVIANLGTLSEYIKFLRTWEAKSKWSFSLVSGILAPAIAGLFAVLLPVALRFLSKYQGAYTKSSLERILMKRLFILFVVSQLFIFSILGVVLNLLVNVVRGVSSLDVGVFIGDLQGLPQAIATAYLMQSSFWMTWLPMRGFLAFFDLANLLKVLLVTSTGLFNQTPRAIRKRTQPPIAQFATRYAATLLIVAVTLIYAPLAPLVTLFGALAIFIQSWTYETSRDVPVKVCVERGLTEAFTVPLLHSLLHSFLRNLSFRFYHKLMFVFENEIETGGEMWPLAIERLLVCVILMQCFVVLTVALQSASWIPSVVSAVVIPLTLLFNFTVLSRFRRLFKTYPSAPSQSPTSTSDESSPQSLSTAEKARALTERALAPIENIISAIDGGIKQGSSSDNRANKIDDLAGKLNAKTSEETDARFGHPALDAKLFTVMVFKKDEHLLSEVYQGRAKKTQADVTELGGGKRQVERVGAGIDVLPVDDSDLEFDSRRDARDSV